jgi:hypothetical protein
MNPAALAAMATLVLGAGPSSRMVRLTQWGTDPAPGILVNLTAGARPFDPPDPARPLLVVIHGLNPLHPAMRFTVAQRYAEVIAARYGDAFNVLAWDWNGVTGHDLRVAAAQRRALAQGYRLAEALLALRVAPEQLQLVGQSAGCLVAATAARRIVERTGRMPGRLTMIDPAAPDHPWIFGRLAAGSAASAVTHYWVPGPSGFGKPAPYPGVTDAAVPGPNGWRGLVNPFRSDHLNAVRWHVGTLWR